MSSIDSPFELDQPQRVTEAFASSHAMKPLGKRDHDTIIHSITQGEKSRRRCTLLVLVNFPPGNRHPGDLILLSLGNRIPERSGRHRWKLSAWRSYSPDRTCRNDLYPLMSYPNGFLNYPLTVLTELPRTKGSPAQKQKGRRVWGQGAGKWTTLQHGLG